jgi:hypothetical protein
MGVLEVGTIRFQLALFLLLSLVYITAGGRCVWVTKPMIDERTDCKMLRQHSRALLMPVGQIDDMLDEVKLYNKRVIFRSMRSGLQGGSHNSQHRKVP